MTPEQHQELIRLLQQGEELSPEWARILFPPEKREYELVYHGKEREEDVLANTLAVPLQPVRTFGGNGGNGKNGWQNMLIFGDNLQVMKALLEEKKKGKLCNADGSPGVRLVYIDPPFATKQEFRGSEDQKAYQDKIAGAEFLEFLRKRLVFLRELLSDDGFVFVHLDWKEVHYVKVLLDEIFQEANFRSEIIVPRPFTKNLQQQFTETKTLNVRHDTLLFYSKKQQTTFPLVWVDKAEVKHPDGHWHHFWSNADRPTMRYALFGITPKTGQWLWEEKKAREAVENYKRYLREGNGRTLLQYWLDTGEKYRFIRQDEEGKPQSWRSPATQQLADTLWLNVMSYENQKVYPTQKHEQLLDRVIRSFSSLGDVILDCFAGSGTTLTVAEKLGRRWIGVDCGKLAVYTMQKRLLSITESKDLEDPKKKYGKTCKPLTLYNAGLYDFSKLKELPWESWRFFALQLFQCRDEPHTIGGVQLDGYLKGSSVLVFNHMKKPGIRIDETTIESLHEALGTRVGNRLFIIAPALTFDFQQDYIKLDDVRYYALRIPYSIINELHQRKFTALKQPSDEMAVNDMVEAVGFDFIRTPELKFDCGVRKGKNGLEDAGFVRIRIFKSEALVREPMQKKGNLETLSMVMLDYDFDEKSQIFDLDAVFYADALRQQGWEVRFPFEGMGKKIMAVFIDIYGNEARVVLDAWQFGKRPKNALKRRTRRTTPKRSSRKLEKARV